LATGSFPAGPRGQILLGNLPELMRDRTGFLLSCARDHGDFVPLRFGPRRAVFINHPDAIAAVLVAGSRTFGKPYILRTDRFRFGDARLGSEGDFWRQQRVAEPSFHRDRLAAYAETMIAATERMLDSWRDGETRDILPEMMRLALQIVGETLFGTDLTDEAERVGSSLATMMDEFVSRLGLLFLVPERLPTPGNLRLRRARRQLVATMDGVVARRRASGEDRGDLLGLLLRAANGAGAAADQQIRNQAMTFFLAGHETTALALTWTWYLLSQHPAVEANLLAELDAVLGGHPPTPADLPRLVYTEWIVKEALRLYPPIWAMGRIALDDANLGGHPISRGTVILLSQWAMHRDPRWFDAPERFDPDRWADGFAKRLPRYAYFPFGGGPRGCIGSRFAMMEAVLILATVAQRFRLTLAPGHPVVPLASITLRPQHGLQMILHRRPDAGVR
jgi:cytochrome P450